MFFFANLSQTFDPPRPHWYSHRRMIDSTERIWFWELCDQHKEVSADNVPTEVLHNGSVFSLPGVLFFYPSHFIFPSSRSLWFTHKAGGTIHLIKLTSPTPPWTLNVTPSEGFQRITKLLLCFLVNVKIPNVVQFFEFGVGAKNTKWRDEPGDHGGVRYASFFPLLGLQFIPALCLPRNLRIFFEDYHGILPRKISPSEFCPSAVQSIVPD